jgi:hypothetical protein
LIFTARLELQMAANDWRIYKKWFSKSLKISFLIDKSFEYAPYISASICLINFLCIWEINFTGTLNYFSIFVPKHFRTRRLKTIIMI